MIQPLFLAEPYRRSAPGQVVAHTPEGGIVLAQSLFYATGGGQPGDSGTLEWDGGRLTITTAIKAGDGQIALVADPDAARPPVGALVEQRLDWDRRIAHMRVHTALHLLSVVIPLPVTGGAISAAKGRIDFNMPDAPENKDALQTTLQGLIDRNLPVSESWITDAELQANPGLVKTMSVSPPRGVGHVRLVQIGQGADKVDLQPCGGTHVANTREIGRIRLGRVEKKGRQNRRVYLHLES